MDAAGFDNFNRHKAMVIRQSDKRQTASFANDPGRRRDRLCAYISLKQANFELGCNKQGQRLQAWSLQCVPGLGLTSANKLSNIWRGAQPASTRSGRSPLTTRLVLCKLRHVFNSQMLKNGEMPEWSNGSVSKTKKIVSIYHHLLLCLASILGTYSPFPALPDIPRNTCITGRVV